MIWYVGTESKNDFTLNSKTYSLNEYLEKGKSYKLKVRITRTPLSGGNSYAIIFYFEENKQQEIASASEENRFFT